jgi:hypothetical protein
MIRFRTACVLVVALALALVACGGGKAKPSGRASSSPTLSLEEADRAVAQTLVLQQADLPAGWTAAPHQKSPDEDAAATQLAACVGAPPPDTSTSADVDGPDLSLGDSSVNSSASFDRTLELARADLAALRSPKLSDCVKDFAVQAIRDALGRTALQSVQFDARQATQYGDATLGFRFIATIKVESRSITVFQDLFFLIKGRAGVSAAFSNVGAPFDQALETSLLATLGSRLAGVTT